MKILVLGLDQTILDPNSLSYERALLYKEMVEKYIVLVPSKKLQQVIISDHMQFFGLAGRNKLIQLFRIFLQSKNILNKEKFDVISIQDVYFLGLLGLILSYWFSVGLEVQVHGWEKKSIWRLIFAKIVLKKADAVRVVSHRLKGELVKKYGVANKKITVVPILAQIKEDKITKFLKSENGNFIFLTVGRLVNVKDINLQIKSLAQLKNKNWELWIVGSGPEQAALQELSKQLRVSEKIQFLGQQDRPSLFKTYQMADCFLLSSLEEGWGLAVVEAAYFGLPIIMTDVGCAGEFIKNNYNGIVVRVGYLTELSQAAKEIMSSKELRLKLGEEARQSFKILPDQAATFKLYLESWQKAKI